MRRMILVACTAGALLTVRSTASAQPGGEAPWTLGGSRPVSYAMDTTGSWRSAQGASFVLRAGALDSVVTGQRFGTIAKSIAADTLKLRRLRLRGELRAIDAPAGVSLWLRIDGASGTLLFDNGAERSVKGSTEWTPFEVTLPVARDAQRIVFGVLLSGAGDAHVRGLTLVASPPIAGGTGVSALPMAEEARTLLDSAIRIVRARSVWRDTITWPAVEEEVRLLAAGAERASDVHPALRVLVRRLGDHHSGFFPPATARGVAQGGRQNPPITVTERSGIGHIVVPAYSGIEPTAMLDHVRATHAALATAAPRVRCGWIVDLRANGGGNMNPMLNGLRPFLGEGPLGFFVSPENRVPWSARAIAAAPTPEALSSLFDAPVAVLTGPRTASSGEIVAISFIGRPKSRSFGQPTAGLSTANAMFPLPDGSMLNVTTAIDADRTGKEYGSRIAPDETVAEDATSATAGSYVAAERWLRANHCADRTR